MKHKMIFKSVLIFIFSVFSIFVFGVSNINIYSVNDLHGYLTEGSKVPGIGKIVAFIKEKENEHPGSNIFLSAGDMFQGTVESNLMHGRNVIDALNYAGCEAMCAGNHEFDWGQDEMKNNTAYSKFPWLAANVVYEKNGKIPDYFKAYTVIEREGINIGIIGLATPTTVINANPKLLEGLKFLDSAKTANKYTDELKNQNVNMIILLTHLGCDQNTETGVITGEAAELANKVKDVDLIVTGHSHTTVNGKVNGILLIQAGEYGKEIGLAHLVWNKPDNVLKSAEGKIFNLMSPEYKDLQPDSGVMKILSKSIKEAEKIKKRVIGNCITPLLHGDHPEKMKLTLLGAFATDLEREKVKAEICLLSWGTWRSSLPPSEKAGKITMGDLYQCIPLDNTLYTLDMKGSVIKKVLEYGINNPRFGMIQFSGVKVVYDNTKPWMYGLKSVTLLNGQPLENNKWYKVVTTDFLANNGGGYPFEGKNRHDSGILTRDVAKEYLETHPDIDYKLDGRFIVTEQKKEN